MIYTLTFNPALDYAVYPTTLVLGKTNRSQTERIDFGGKGINVSYVLHQLGEPTTALGFVAGFTGRALCDMLQEAGVRCDFVRLPGGMTRINVKIKSDAETEINASGPDIPVEALETLYGKLDAMVAGDTLLLAGSLPTTLPHDVYETICARITGRGIRLAVDAEGALLQSVLKYHPFVIKPNRDELSAIAGRELTEDADIEAAARVLPVATFTCFPVS